MKKVNYHVTVFAFFVISIFLLSTTFTTAQVTGKSVKLGVLVPITSSSGDDAKGQVLAAEIARDEINASGGIGGVPLELVIYDTRVDLKENIIIFKKLALVDKVLSIMGPTMSSECEVVFPIANELKIVCVSPASAKPGVSAKNRPWAFRNGRMADAKMEPAIKKWIEMNNIKKVFTVYDAKDALPKSEAMGIFPPILKKCGVENLDFLTFMTGDMDFSAQVTKIRSSNPGGLLISGPPTEIANFVRECRKQGLRQPILGGAQAYQIDIITVGGKDVEGLITGGHTWVDKPDPRLQSFVKKYKERGKTSLPPKLAGGPPDCNQITMYDGIMVNKLSMEKYKITNQPGDLEKDREKVREGWTNLKDYPGIAGLTTMSPDGDAVGDTYVIMVKGGRFVAVK